VSGYTIKNLKDDVEDVAPKFGMGEIMQTRFVRDQLEAEQFGLSLQRVAPNQRVPFGHRHAQQEEVYVVVDGSGRVKLDDEVRDVRRWDAVRVSRETVRAFEAGPDGLELIAFGAPNTGLQDAEQLPGWWSD
jgi:quercetin dioxygenase-like cupin family protein